MAVPAVKRSRGQVLVLFALVLPLLVVPVVGYGVDSAVLASRHASLQAATAEAAEIAVQRIDIDALRRAGTLQIDARDLRAAVAAVLSVEEPNGVLESVAAAGSVITLESSERVELPIPFLTRSAVVRARSTAQIVPGYGSPSSFLPFSTSTF